MNKRRPAGSAEKDYRSLLVHENLPGHVAIIMDGNGRWATNRHLPRLAGHRAGIDTVRKIVKIAGELGIRYLTLYAFSVENWRRPKSEVSGLMRLLGTFLRRETKELDRQRVQVSWIGRVDEFPAKVVAELERSRDITVDNDGLRLILALNYGARREIVEAVRSIVSAVGEGQIDAADISEDMVSQYLYTSEISDPDLIVRTSGEMRLSNFLLWQAAYSELWITDILWPDFTENDFCHALYDFQHRARSYGGITGKHGAADKV